MTSEWKTYRPAKVGQAPFDWVPGSEAEYETWNGEWKRPTGDGPGWFTANTYRYRPSAILGSAANSLSEDDATRLEFPMFDGLMAYFPNALAEVARVSKIGNDQHNPGEPMHWARGKSTDHENKIMRHLVDVGRKDVRGVRHAARLAWRSLALLQEELEREEGAPMSRGSRDAVAGR